MFVNFILYLTSEIIKMCNNYCIKCACKVPVFFGHRRVLIEHGSIKTTFDEEYAICQYCGEKVYDPKVHDKNVKARERAMDEARKEQLKGENKYL